MRVIVLFLVGIALPNVYTKYLLLEIDGNVTPEVEPETDAEEENGVDEGTGDPSRDYKNDSDYPNAVPETPEKPPKTMKEALKAKSKRNFQPNKNKKNAGSRSLGGSSSSLKSHPKRKLVNTKRCGYTRGFQQKIVGGVDAELKDFPWLVMIAPVEDDGTVAMYNCGGSLITMSVVLTAAHCLFPQGSDVQYDKLRVKIGAETRDQRGGFEEIDVVKKIPHEKYEPDPDFKNDIALLRLKHAYDNKGKKFKANTICLPFDEKPNEKYLDIDVTIAGWGYTKVAEDGEGSDPANQLQKLVTGVMPYAKCQQAHADSGSPVLEANNVCAGGEEGKDSCSGDSGGPLMIEKTANKPRKYWTQIGLVSWGVVCGTPGIPGVYTNVQHYLKWILDHL